MEFILQGKKVPLSVELIMQGKKAFCPWNWLGKVNSLMSVELIIQGKQSHVCGIDYLG